MAIRQQECSSNSSALKQSESRHSKLNDHNGRHGTNNVVQSIRFGDNESSSARVECGVPQGSMLDPLSFVLYKAELNSVTDVHGIGQCSEIRILRFSDFENMTFTFF